MSKPTQQSTDLAKQPTPREALRKAVLDAQPTWAAMLPSHMRDTPDRLFRSFVASINANPILGECTKGSMILAMTTAAGLGILPGGPLKHGVLVPYKNKQGVYEAQFQIMYQGLIMLAINSGHVLAIQGEVICRNDFYRVRRGTMMELDHEIDPTKDRGEMIAAYGVAWLPGMPKPIYRLLPKAEVEKHRLASQAAASEFSPWNTGWYNEMAMKTAIRSLAKVLPSSEEKSARLYQAIEHDEQLDRGERPIPAGMESLMNMLDEGQEAPKSRAESLADKVGQ